MKKTFVILFVLVIVIASVAGYFMYTRSHDNLASAKPDFELSAGELLEEFATNQDAANARYLNKVIEVRGVVDDVMEDQSMITVRIVEPGDYNGVSAQFIEQNKADAVIAPNGSDIKVRGLCSGYTGDDMMPGDVVLTNAVIIP